MLKSEGQYNNYYIYYYYLILLIVAFDYFEETAQQTVFRNLLESNQQGFFLSMAFSRCFFTSYLQVEPDSRY